MSDALARARNFRDPGKPRNGVTLTYRKPIVARVCIGKRRYIMRSFDDASDAMEWAESERARVAAQQADFVPLPRRR